MHYFKSRPAIGVCFLNIWTAGKRELLQSGNGLVQLVDKPGCGQFSPIPVFTVPLFREEVVRNRRQYMLGFVTNATDIISNTLYN